MRCARKLELLCNARSYCPLWRTFAAAPGSAGVCADAGAADNTSSAPIKIVHERLVILTSLSLSIAYKPILAIVEPGSSYLAS